MSVVPILVRAVVLVVVAFVAGWLANLGYEGTGANIGSGLLAFAAVLLASLVWAFLDARGDARVGPTILVWAVVALLVGVAAAVQAQLSAPSIDPDVLLSDLAGLAPFVASLVFVPALVGVGAGVIVRRGRPGAED